MREGGQKVRAATGCDLGSDGDRLIWAVTGHEMDDGTTLVDEERQIRAGTRFIMTDGTDLSLLDLIERTGGWVTEDGYIQIEENGPKMPFHWRFTDNLPKPEDYILQRSQVTLHEIYTENDWEAVGPQLPRPLYGEKGPVYTADPRSWTH